MKINILNFQKAVESEYASQQTEDEPTVMSRQAKYNKNLKYGF